MRMDTQEQTADGAAFNRFNREITRLNIWKYQLENLH